MQGTCVARLLVWLVLNDRVQPSFIAGVLVTAEAWLQRERVAQLTERGGGGGGGVQGGGGFHPDRHVHRHPE